MLALTVAKGKLVFIKLDEVYVEHVTSTMDNSFADKEVFHKEMMAWLPPGEACDLSKVTISAEVLADTTGRAYPPGKRKADDSKKGKGQEGEGGPGRHRAGRRRRRGARRYADQAQE